MVTTPILHVLTVGSPEPTTPTSASFVSLRFTSPRPGPPAGSAHLVTQRGELALQFPLLSQHLLLILVFLLKLHFHLFQLEGHGDRGPSVLSGAGASRASSLWIPPPRENCGAG